jgi:hypothetical protein
MNAARLAHSSFRRLETARIQAERLKEDVKLELGFAAEDCRLEAMALEAGRKLIAERVEIYDRIEAERRETDRARALVIAERFALEGIEAEKLLACRRRLAEQRSVGHGRTVNDKKKVVLIKEMERVFSERFKEKQGGRIMSSELADVFSKSTTISEFDENFFKYHSRNLFLDQWTNARCSTYQHKRCYTGVVVKSDE